MTRAPYMSGAKEGLSELGVLVIDTIHVVHCLDEGGHVDLIQVQTPGAVVVSLDASDGIDAEFGLGLDIFPGDHGDVLIEGPKIDQWLDDRYTFFQGTNVRQIGEYICLEVFSVGTSRERRGDLKEAVINR